MRENSNEPSGHSTPRSDQLHQCGAGDNYEEAPRYNSDASGYTSGSETSANNLLCCIPSWFHSNAVPSSEINSSPGTSRYRRERTFSTSSTTSSDSNFDAALFHNQQLNQSLALHQHHHVNKQMVLDPKFATRNDYGSIHSTDATIAPLTGASQSQPYTTYHHYHHHHPHTPVLDLSLSLSSTGSLDSTDDAQHTSSVASSKSPNGNSTSSGKKMTQGDLYQRQPLLPTPTKNSDKWSKKATMGASEYFEDDDEDERDEIVRCNGGGGGGGILGQNGMIKISMPPPVREEPKFPKEKWKTLIALIVMIVNFILTTASLALVHERVPDRDKYDPLPDKFLDTVPAFDWALDVSEYLIMISVNATALVLVFHKHRFIVFRRVFLILALLYLMRAITMYITVLPVASKTYYCSPKANQTSAYLITTRVLQLISGFGLSVNGKHTYCGDYIYSGHTVILVLSYLLISEYSPKRFFPLHWISWLVSLTGVIMVLLAHGHYTVDVVIAYYITTRLFWAYHTLANNTQLKKSGGNNYVGREWWFPFFQYFEKNVGGPVPRLHDWPLPWPRRLHSKSRDS